MTVVTHWSKSSLSTVLDGCSWQWYLSKVEGLPDPGGPDTWRGTAVHAGIEAAERYRLVYGGHPDIDLAWRIADVALNTEVERGKPTDEVWARNRTNLNVLKLQVQDAIANWWDSELKDDGRPFRELVADWQPIAFEAPFDVFLPGSPRRLRGFIDAIYWDPEAHEYVVVDLKTANRLDRWKSAEGHEREGALYIWGAQQSEALPTHGRVRMEWHVMRNERGKTKRFEGARRVVLELEDYHTAWAWDDVTRADRILAEGLFAPNPHWNLCAERWCPFFHGCQVTGELQPDRLQAT